MPSESLPVYLMLNNASFFFQKGKQLDTSGMKYGFGNQKSGIFYQLKVYLKTFCFLLLLLFVLIVWFSFDF